jgi:hypothetical protein
VGWKPIGEAGFPKSAVAAIGALLVATALTFITSAASAAGEASVSLTKSASTASAPPGTPFTDDLKYSCSSLTTNCAGVTIQDVLPAQLSRAAADVTLIADAHTAKTS